MAITTLTRDQLRALALVYLQTAYPGKPTGPMSFLGQMAESLADLVGAIQAAILDADNDGVPAYATADQVIRSRCSSAALDNWATVFGLASNLGPGRFGRNGAVVAKGGAGSVIGLVGSIQPSALLVDPSGAIQVRLVGGLVIPPGGSIPGVFQAVVAGAAGNLAGGTRLQFVSPAPGIFPYVLLETGLSGGYDVESDAHLLERLITHLRSPPKGGTAADYRRWAEESTDSTGGSLGIGRAYVYPHRDGLGSEDIVITTLGGSGRGRAPTLATQALVQTYLDSVRPVNDAPTAILPTFDDARGLSIVAKVQPTIDHPWDWVGPPLPAFGVFGDRTKINIALTDLQPLGVNTPFYQAYLDGKRPRIQIVLSESPLPQVRQCISSVVLGLSIQFTLDAPLSSVAGSPSLIYPAGPGVLPTAVAMLNYLDNVGPSKQCGFYDRVTDDWEAIVTVGKLAHAALGAVDEVGQRVNVYSPGVGQGVGITIAVGGGAAAGADVLLFDNATPHTIGPELPWATSILVLPIT